MCDPWFGLPRIQWEIFKGSSVLDEPLVRAQPFWGEIGWCFGPDLEWQVGHQTSLWSWRAEEASWRSVGLSEAEDWLGREVSRPWEDPEGCLYRKQAMAKKRKPSTWGDRSCWMELPDQRSCPQGPHTRSSEPPSDLHSS